VNRSMIRLILLLLLTALAILSEPIVNSEVSNPTIRPDVLMIPIMVAVVACPGPIAVFWGSLMGLVCDCLTGPWLGPQMGAFALIAAIGSSISSRSKSIVGVFVLSCGCAFAARIFSLAIRSTSDVTSVFTAPALAQVVGASLTTAILIVGVCFAARRITRPFARRGSEESRIVSIGWQRSTD
jgi:rod shape-determining protein MreD